MIAFVLQFFAKFKTKSTLFFAGFGVLLVSLVRILFLKNKNQKHNIFNLRQEIQAQKDLSDHEKKQIMFGEKNKALYEKLISNNNHNIEKAKEKRGKGDEDEDNFSGFSNVDV